MLIQLYRRKGIRVCASVNFYVAFLYYIFLRNFICNFLIAMIMMIFSERKFFFLYISRLCFLFFWHLFLFHVPFFFSLCEDDFLPLLEKLLANRARLDSSISGSSREINRSFSRTRLLLSRHLDCQMTLPLLMFWRRIVHEYHRRRRFGVSRTI